jgi:hypothetical protein
LEWLEWQVLCRGYGTPLPLIDGSDWVMISLFFVITAIRIAFFLSKHRN